MYALTPPPPPTLSLPEQERIRSYLEAGVAPATRRAYQSSWEAWHRWCDARQVPALPAAPEQLVAWLSERADGGAKVATLEKDLAALAAVHRIAEMLGPRSHPAVRAVLRGIRRKVGVAQRQVTALRVEDLRAALPRGEGARVLRDRALLLVGFAGALRRSELVALDHGDVEFRPEGMVLRLRASKTDPERRGVLVAIPYAKRADLCPVRALRCWKELCEGEGALFRSVNRWGKVGGRLSDRAVALLVKDAARRGGLDPALYAGHSLRAGFATSAVAAGVPEQAIMRQTRHRSVVVFRQYVRAGGLFLENAVGGVL
jgi:site-specific recombinase XerD